jgi:membrane protease YdiL (CAAX protease family)
MDSDRQPDGGVEPTPDPAGPDPDTGPPLYKSGSMKQRIRSLLHTVVLVAGAFIASNVFSLAALQGVVAAGLLDVPAGFSSVADLPTSGTVLLFVMNFVGFFAVGWAYLRWRGESVFDTSLYDLAVPSLRQVGQALAGLVVLFVLLVTISNIAAQFGISSSENVTQTLGEGNPQLLLYLIPIALLLNGPIEEFLFRGLVQGLFRDAYGLLPGIALSAAVFGVVHYFAVAGGGGNIVFTLTVIAALGTLLGVLYEWSENLFVPGLVHGLFNAVQYAGLYVATTGGA